MKKFAFACLLLMLSFNAAHAEGDATLLPLTPKANIKAPSNLGAPAQQTTPLQVVPQPTTPNNAPGSSQALLDQPATKTTIGEYIPFPMGFDKMNQANKDAVLKSVDENTDKYFRSKEYGMALAKFVETINPHNIHECRQLSMDRDRNKINVIEPLLFAKATDRHPMVGKWEQNVSFTGCSKTYAFIIVAAANKAKEPMLSFRE